MSFLDRVRTANTFDPSDYQPILIDEAIVGWVRPEIRHALLDGSGVFRPRGDGLVLHSELETPAARTVQVGQVLDGLRRAGLVPPSRQERVAVRAQLDDEPLMTIDRSAVEALGVIATGFHLNGLIGDEMWIAKRSSTKATCPGELDNMVAGGLPVGLSLEDNVIKECGEEAGMKPDLARRARPVGCLTYVMSSHRGLRRHAMWLFDLDVPDTFEPTPVDGEVAWFKRMPIEAVAAIVRDTEDFKFNSSLAVIDLLMRTDRIQGGTSERLQLRSGLSSPLSIHSGQPSG